MVLSQCRARRRPVCVLARAPGHEPTAHLRQDQLGAEPRNPGARRTISTMAEWWSIEVLHGGFSAFRWQEQHDSALIEAALTNGAVDGAWHADRWGVVFEICFGNEERRETFRSLPAVRAALDGVPDPVNGLFIYRGRGGAAADRKPAQPRPPSASAVSRPEPYPALTPRRIWTSPAFHRRIRCTPGPQKGQGPDPPGMAWGSGPRHPGRCGRTAPGSHLIEASSRPCHHADSGR